MVSCFLQGGLGNQLFQIATTISYANDNDIDPVFNFGTHFLPLQGNKANTYKENIFKNLKEIDEVSWSSFKIYNEPNFYYNKIPTNLSVNNILLNGYFQSEKYFINCRKKILNTVQPTKEIIKYMEKYKNLFSKKTCSVHIRRGDYLKFPKEHPVLSKEYYYNAFNEFDNETNFLLFSDDIIWCKNNLNHKHLHFIDEKLDYINLYLMSLCDNNIIANSSFSWWGAWLNKNQNKKIIAPNVWFGENKKLETKDIIPKKWKRF